MIDKLLKFQFTPIIFDVECYPNFFCILFKHIETKEIFTFEMSENSDIDYEKLNWILYHMILIGFNSISYDIPMIIACLNKYNCEQLKKLSDKIIKENLRSNIIYEQEKLNPLTKIDHIDLIQLTALAPGLKTLAGRMHAKKMQDLPYDPDSNLTKEESENVKTYCVNDLDNTILLYNTLKPQIELRYILTEQYRIDLRSKSDAQIAEAVIVSELGKLSKYPLRTPKLEPGTLIRYKMPSYISFELPQLLEAKKLIEDTEFQLDNLGSPILSKELENFEIKINKTEYNLQMGGLHSKEKSQTYTAKDGFRLFDRDVDSYYPSIILNQNLYPSHCGNNFIKIFKPIVEKRLEAKKKKDKVTANTLKIVINGSFGKFGSKYSKIYSPQLMLQVTLSGQLSLLMLIEKMELAGIPIISANTDGIISYVHETQINLYLSIVEEWEKLTNFKTSETEYKAVYSRDVNNYIAVKMDNECKYKGIFSDPNTLKNEPAEALKKNAGFQIITDCLINYLVNNIPFHETVKLCKDITKFTTIRKVKGGAYQESKYIGKIIRWYHSKDNKNTINYVSNGNKVPDSDGAKPCLELPDVFPQDVDYDYYVKRAEKLLYEIGFKTRKLGLF